MLLEMLDVDTEVHGGALETMDIDQADLDSRVLNSKCSLSEMYDELKSGHFIRQMIMNKPVLAVLPNASISRVLVPMKKPTYHFST